MSRIIAEKSRQRTTSTGSLDGMVITRENELIALPSADAYEVAKAAAEAYAAAEANRAAATKRRLSTPTPPEQQLASGIDDDDPKLTHSDPKATVNAALPQLAENTEGAREQSRRKVSAIPVNHVSLKNECCEQPLDCTREWAV